MRHLVFAAADAQLALGLCRSVALATECKIWNEVFKFEVPIIKLGGRDCMVMPFLRPIAKADYENDGKIRTAADAATTLLSRAGIVHQDLSWRHVGLVCADDGTPALPYKAALLDFGLVAAAKPSEAKVEMNQRLGLAVPDAAAKSS